MIGKTLGHNRIIEKLGEGGMGEVYRAFDEHLQRDVALKILPRGKLGDEAARKRFRKEALALARLNHPNIESVYDFDTQDGTDFLVMEYIPGQTLGERLSARPLAEREMAGIGTQLAEGLTAAHQQGIIHRDLKPANLLVTPDGRLKILDFGLAKLLQPVDEATTTESSSSAVAGTLPYMAPEQLRGEKLDARTDLYAAGNVLYEMACGHRPFREDTAPRLIDAILHQAPLTPKALNPKLTPRLGEIILKCLDKDPENRYQSAVELAVDLRRLHAPAPAAMPQPKRKRITPVTAFMLAVLAVVACLAYFGRNLWLGSSVPRIESLAVIPLANMSGDPDQEYFADGMTEILITELSKIGSLKVISRTSVMRYKGTAKPLPEIGRELNVDGIVEGSVLRIGDRTRITAQLIWAATDQHVWADTFERDLRDVLALQSEVASAIAMRIRARITAEQQAILGHNRRVDPEAHEAYLKARFLMARFTEEDVVKAIAELERARARDPNDPLVHASLAFSHFYVAVPLNWQRPWREDLAAAKAEAARAVELDDTLAEAHAALAAVLLFKDWDWSAAGREYRRAIELDPNSSDTHGAYAVYLNCAGNRQKALEEIERAVELDPMNLRTRSLLGEILYLARQYDRSMAELDKVLELDPNFQRALGVKAWHYQLREMVPQLLDILDKGMAPPEIAAAGRRAYNAGGTEGFKRWYVRVHEEQQKTEYVAPSKLARAYALIGDAEHTLAYLMREYEEHDTQMIFINIKPEFDFLHSNPQFQELVRATGIPH